MDEMALKRLEHNLRSLIENAQVAIAHTAAPRNLQRVIALLWSAHDELEQLTRVPPGKRTIAR
jgi:hypothetical protein